MLETPLPLREYCLEFLRESISVTCFSKDNQSIDDKNDLINEQKFKNNLNINKNNGNNVVINGNLTEELLESLSANNQLTDEVLLMSIFDSDCTQLRHVRIPDASQLTTKGLRALKTHRINELEVCGLIKCTINELIGCLGEWSLLRLRYLNVAHSSFTSSNKVSAYRLFFIDSFIVLLVLICFFLFRFLGFSLCVFMLFVEFA
jgi:Zyg-11 family protein